MPHLAFTLLTAVFLAIALALPEDRSPRQRLHAAARMFACCVSAVVAGGWLMYLIHS